MLRNSYMYGASSNTILNYNLVRFGVCMIKLRHERILILRCIFPQKNWITSRKKITPPPPPEKSRTPWQETQVTRNILIPWETLSFWKISAFPPPPPKKRKSESQENEITSLLVKVSTTLKLPQPLWKSLKTPTCKIFNFSKNPNSIGKIFNSFEVTRPMPIMLGLRESQVLKLNSFRKLQSSHAHENIN